VRVLEISAILWYNGYGKKSLVDPLVRHSDDTEVIMEQSIQYLKAIMYIASADNRVSEEEFEYFLGIAVSNGLTEEDATSIRLEIESNTLLLSEILKEITNEKTKKKLIHDLLLICLTDGDYSVAEQNGIKDICGLLEISDKKLVQYEREAKFIHTTQKASNSVLGAINAGTKGTARLGKKAFDGSKTALRSVADGLNTIGSKISFSLESAKKAKEENKELREQLKKNTLTEAVKQKVIIQLAAKIASLKEQLQNEKKRNQQNEEMIRELQAQIEDLLLTMEVAENAKTA
jgi:uncharacterized tellurite resistance protein B-like protein